MPHLLQNDMHFISKLNTLKTIQFYKLVVVEMNVSFFIWQGFIGFDSVQCTNINFKPKSCLYYPVYPSL